MTETIQSNNTNDKLSVLLKEAEHLKTKLEEERLKLNDVNRNIKPNPPIIINILNSFS